MEQTFDRQEALRALRVAIRSVRRTPIRIPFGDDDKVLHRDQNTEVCRTA